MDCCGDHAVIIVVYFRTLPFPSFSPCLLVLSTPWFPSSAYSLGVHHCGFCADAGSPRSVSPAPASSPCPVLIGLFLCTEDSICPWPLRMQAMKVSEPRAGGKGCLLLLSCSFRSFHTRLCTASFFLPPLPFAVHFQGQAVAEHFSI